MPLCEQCKQSLVAKKDKGTPDLKPGFVDVVNHPGPRLALSLFSQDFALGANTAIPLRLIEECARWKLVW